MNSSGIDHIFICVIISIQIVINNTELMSLQLGFDLSGWNQFHQVIVQICRLLMDEHIYILQALEPRQNSWSSFSMKSLTIHLGHSVSR